MLHVDLDVFNLYLPKARSQVGEYWSLSNISFNGSKQPTVPPSLNEPVFTLCRKLHNLGISVIESELVPFFKNSQEVVVTRKILLNLVFPQSPTPIKPDNSTTYSIPNK